MWGDRKKDNAIVDAIESIKKLNVIPCDTPEQLEIIRSYINSLGATAAWSKKFPHINQDRETLIRMLHKIKDDAEEERDSHYCIDCSNYGDSACDHKYNTSMDLVNGVIESHYDTILDFRTEYCKGFYFENK
jgi:hypothetical protein